MVTPFSTGGFNANIVSNTYTDGKGIITFDDNLTSIGNYAFANCSGLTSVTLGSGVTSIGGNTFFNCRDLDSIMCYASTTPTICYTLECGVTYLYSGVSGTLYVPSGSDYSSWMNSDAYYLGYHGWTIKYI